AEKLDLILERAHPNIQKLVLKYLIAHPEWLGIFLRIDAPKLAEHRADPSIINTQHLGIMGKLTMGKLPGYLTNIKEGSLDDPTSIKLIFAIALNTPTLYNTLLEYLAQMSTDKIALLDQYTRKQLDALLIVTNPNKTAAKQQINTLLDEIRSDERLHHAVMFTLANFPANHIANLNLNILQTEMRPLILLGKLNNQPKEASQTALEDILSTAAGEQTLHTCAITVLQSPLWRFLSESSLRIFSGNEKQLPAYLNRIVKIIPARQKEETEKRRRQEEAERLQREEAKHAQREAEEAKAHRRQEEEQRDREEAEAAGKRTRAEKPRNQAGQPVATSGDAPPPPAEAEEPPAPAAELEAREPVIDWPTIFSWILDYRNHATELDKIKWQEHQHSLDDDEQFNLFITALIESINRQDNNSIVLLSHLASRFDSITIFKIHSQICFLVSEAITDSIKLQLQDLTNDSILDLTQQYLNIITPVNPATSMLITIIEQNFILINNTYSQYKNPDCLKEIQKILFYLYAWKATTGIFPKLELSEPTIAALANNAATQNILQKLNLITTPPRSSAIFSRKAPVHQETQQLDQFLMKNNQAILFLRNIDSFITATQNQGELSQHIESLNFNCYDKTSVPGWNIAWKNATGMAEPPSVL
ncbi:MAG: hypothetical protein KAT71_06920, partial [Gammaproteobacteria bacterium]|nr:hypothetical protein [Gammaproteobacteria bacterium]